LTPGMVVAPFFNGSAACGVEAARVPDRCRLRLHRRVDAGAHIGGCLFERIELLPDLGRRIEAPELVDRLLDVVEFGFLQGIVELRLEIAAMARSFAVVRPKVRSILGKSLGPTTTIMTIAMTSISVQPTSNMALCSD
jgi:hypothetical protein